MKNTLILLLGVALAIQSCDLAKQEVELPADTDLPVYAEVEAYESFPGLSHATLSLEENIDEEGDLLDGRKNGSWTVYHKNELVKSMTTYVKGIQQGNAIEMDDKGNLIKKVHYVNGIENGEAIFYAKGKIIERKQYENGQLTGKKSKFYSSGKIMEESTWSEGKMHGPAKWYDQDGNVTIEYEYNQGDLIKE
jgi:antitoxin component YwqK of YwqJK toxin-antitoxin module